jgi:hypothetical protein
LPKVGVFCAIPIRDRPASTVGGLQASYQVPPWSGPFPVRLSALDFLTACWSLQNEGKAA